MGVNWDKHLLGPLHREFGDEHEYRPQRETPFPVNGVFDRGYAQVSENLDGDSEINTTNPVLGVRDADFSGRPMPAQGDRVFIKTVGGQPVNQLYVVADVQPDSHGGTKLVLNMVKKR
ncbi:hypothetical protein RI049_09760 [Cedecea neteri]|uniref:head-tail joining protein n=1 Tax=Cedecea neteri TaxID=158822 RepID=UPI002AA64A44|nr:hypothetical protein [Cedecea neteri]WPU24997.1 hypothetical protein RI049_09760 [Cedecea neteri]